MASDPISSVNWLRIMNEREGRCRGIFEIPAFVWWLTDNTSWKCLLLFAALLEKYPFFGRAFTIQIRNYIMSLTHFRVQTVIQKCIRGRPRNPWRVSVKGGELEVLARGKQESFHVATALVCLQYCIHPCYYISWHSTVTLVKIPYQSSLTFELSVS
jgi:hypothetical protein